MRRATRPRSRPWQPSRDRRPAALAPRPPRPDRRTALRTRQRHGHGHGHGLSLRKTDHSATPDRWRSAVPASTLEAARSRRARRCSTPDPSSWFYDITLPGPSLIRTERRPATSVIHLQWSRSKHTPWIGCGPLSNCGLSARILGGLERRLGDRVVQPTGGFLPVPRHDVDPDDDTSPNDALGGDIEKASGRLLIVNTTAGGDGDRASAHYSPTSFGLDVPEEATTLLRDQVEGPHLLGVAGFHQVSVAERHQGKRSARSTVSGFSDQCRGLAARLAGELEVKLEVSPITFGFGRSHSGHGTGGGGCAPGRQGQDAAGGCS